MSAEEKRGIEGSVTVPAGTTADRYPITATYVPAGNFTTSSDTAKQVSIAKATPAISCSNPADITSGTTLNSTQLNATANAAGTQNLSLTGTGLVGVPIIKGGALGSGTQSASVMYVDVQPTNSGTGLAKNVTIKQLSAYKIPFGAVTIASNTPALPIAVGTLAPGASQTVRLYFNLTALPLILGVAEEGTFQNACGQAQNFASAEVVLNFPKN